MATLTISSRAFNQDTGKAKKATAYGPVIITDRGSPSHVLLSFNDFSQLTQKRISVADALYMPGAEEIELELLERVPYIPVEIDF